jgi:uncharacterized protein YndB with AHSA1/START domain
MYGTLEQTLDGSWRIRFERTLPHPVEKVWRAVTEPDHLSAWFPTTIEGDRAPGAQLRFSFPESAGVDLDAFEGEMLAFDPPSLMELRWGSDVLRIELRPVPEGTRLTLLDTLEARGKGARDAAGWHGCLSALEAHLSGDADARAALDGWKDVRSHYVEAFGPEAATIGPPEGIE